MINKQKLIEWLKLNGDTSTDTTEFMVGFSDCCINLLIQIEGGLFDIKEEPTC